MSSWLTSDSQSPPLWITGTCLDIISARHVRTSSPQRLRSVQAHKVTTRWRCGTIYSQLNRANYKLQWAAINKEIRFMKIIIKSSSHLYYSKVKWSWQFTVRATGGNQLCLKRIIGHYSHPGRAGQGSHPHYPDKAHWERRGHRIRLIIIIWVTN